MSYNSLHILDAADQGANYATQVPMTKPIRNARTAVEIIANNNNAGNTKFDLKDVLAGYAEAGGVGFRAARIIGYANSGHHDQLGSRGLRERVRNAGPHKMRRLHELMKEHNMQAEVNMQAQHVPLFYTFERLLQLFFHDYQAVTIPHHIRNWVPEEGSFWAHWWKER